MEEYLLNSFTYDAEGFGKIRAYDIANALRSCLNLTLRVENATFSLILRCKNTHLAMAKLRFLRLV